MRLTFSKIVITFILLFGSVGMNAQSSDLFRLEYLNVPNSNSGNSVSRFRTFFQLPLEFKKNNYIIIGGEYRYTNLEINDAPFNTDDLKSVQRIEASLGYCYIPEESIWIYGARAGMRLQSNFESKLVSDDYIYVANLYFIRDRTKDRESGKPDRLILGLEYSTTPGRDFPLPIINYYREFHPDWTYTIGVPKTNVRYKFDDTNHVQAFLTLDNFFGNIQKNKEVNGQIAENISMTTILGGLGYEHYFTKHIMYYGYVAYTISNDFRLRNNNRDDIYTFEDKGSIYLRTGIKFKI